jgi:pyrroloquinoline quinone (PQQ) biosynthesis protein C
MPVDVQRLLRELREELRPVEARIVGHPYLSALERGEVSRAGLQEFARQQYHIIASDLRSVALAVARAPAGAAQDFFRHALQAEAAAFEHLKAFGTALGLTEEALRAADPVPRAFGYSAYVTWLACYGSAAEFAAAFLVNLPAWGANCGRVSRALQSRYGLASAAVAFFDMFATPPAGFEEAATAVITDGVARGVEPGLIRRAAYLLQGYELLYWDTLHQAGAKTG